MALLVKRSKSHSECEETERWYRWGEHVINQGSSQPTESHCKADVDLSRCLHTGKYFEGMTGAGCKMERKPERHHIPLTKMNCEWKEEAPNSQTAVIWSLNTVSSKSTCSNHHCNASLPSSATSTSLNCKKLTLNIEETAAS